MQVVTDDDSIYESFERLEEHPYYVSSLRQDMQNRPEIRSKRGGEWSEKPRDVIQLIQPLPTERKTTILFVMYHCSSSDHDVSPDRLQTLREGYYAECLGGMVDRIWPGATQRIWWLSPCVPQKNADNENVPLPPLLKEEVYELSMRYILEEIRPRVIISFARFVKYHLFQRLRVRRPELSWTFENLGSEVYLLLAPHPFVALKLDGQEAEKRDWESMEEELRTIAPFRVDDFHRDLKHRSPILGWRAKEHEEILKKRKRQRETRSKLERQLEKDDDNYNPDTDSAQKRFDRIKQRKLTSPLARFLVIQEHPATSHHPSATEKSTKGDNGEH